VGAALALKHGAHSEVALAPRITSLRKSLLARMGLRAVELDWQCRELLDLYCRAKSKVAAVDAWLETNELVRADGTYPPVLKLYVSSLNSATRALEALRSALRERSQTDAQYMRALDALNHE